MKNLLLIFTLSILFAACEKEEIEAATSSAVTHTVTIYAYSEQGFSVINYTDASGDNFITSIYTESETINTRQSEDSYKYSVTLSSQGADSLFLMATYNGKSTSMGFRSTTPFSENKISIDLNEMK
jgi:hypothetical protein